MFTLQLSTALLLIAGALAFLLLLDDYATRSPSVPACREDELVLGRGDFTHDGYWNDYVCVPADVWRN